MAASIFLALVVSLPVLIPASPIENARIVRHGARPCCGSGVLHFTVTYEVEAPNGGRYVMDQTYLGDDDFIAPPGSRCTIWFGLHDGRTIVHEGHGGETGAPHLLITHMECDSGRIG